MITNQTAVAAPVKDISTAPQPVTTERTECNICDRPGTFSEATDIARVHSNVRRFRQQVFTVWRCRNCGTLHSKESIDLDHYYAYYPAARRPASEHLSAGHVALQPLDRVIGRSRLKLIRRFGFDRSARILDYGCNQGAFVTYLRLLGYSQAFGFDRYHPPYDDASVLDSKYDVIALQDVIEHVTDPRALLSRLACCLRKNGIIIIGTPNAAEIDLSQAECQWNFELHQPYHRQILTEDSIKTMARRLALQVKMVRRRWVVDSPLPFVNARFVAAYVRRKENIADSIVSEPLDLGAVIRSPALLACGFGGYLWRRRGNILMVLRTAY